MHTVVVRSLVCIQTHTSLVEFSWCGDHDDDYHGTLTPASSSRSDSSAYLFVSMCVSGHPKFKFDDSTLSAAKQAGKDLGGSEPQALQNLSSFTYKIVEITQDNNSVAEGTSLHRTQTDTKGL